MKKKNRQSEKDKMLPFPWKSSAPYWLHQSKKSVDVERDFDALVKKRLFEERQEN